MTGHLPRLNPDYLQRPRLLRLLDRWAPLTVLLAPSGTGKAVLAVQWAHHVRAGGDDVVWLDGEVDEPGEAVAALARYAGVAPGRDDVATLRRLRRDLQGGERRVAVVVNNAEPLLPALGDALTEIVRDCEQVHLVVCLRRRLDPVAKALLETEARVIGLADLMFTVEEVIEVAATRGVRMTYEEAREVRASVNGWAALVRTGFETAPDATGRSVTSWSRRHVEWFLTHNVVPRLPPSADDAVCRVALLERPTYGSVVAATGPLDEVATLTLEIVGVLDPMVRSGEPLVRFPSVMHRFFAERYDEARLGPAADLHDAVVTYWLAEDEPRAALRQAVAGERWHSAVWIVEQHWWAMVAVDARGVVADVRAIPTPAFAGRVRAQLVRQVVARRGEDAETPETRAALAQLETASTGSPEELELLALVVMRERRRGRFDVSLRYAARVESVVARHDAGGLGVVARTARLASLQAGTTRLVTGELLGAGRSLAWATGGLPRDRAGAVAAARLALASAVCGEVRESARWSQEGVHGSAVPVAEVARAVLTLDRSAIDLSQLVSAVGVDDEAWPFAVWARTEHALLWGGRTRLLAELAALRSHLGPGIRSPWAAGLVTACEAVLSLSLGRAAAAVRLLDGADPDDSAPVLARALLAIVSGEPDAAVPPLDALLGSERTTVRERVEALLLLAWCRDDAVALRAAVEHARDDRLIGPFGHVPREVLRAHVGAVPEVAVVLEALDEAGVREPFAVSDPVPTLTPREHSVLACLVRGLSLEQTARELVVSRNTVKTQTSSIYRKLGVSSRPEALARARRLGLTGA